MILVIIPGSMVVTSNEPRTMLGFRVQIPTLPTVQLCDLECYLRVLCLRFFLIYKACVIVINAYFMEFSED